MAATCEALSPAASLKGGARVKAQVAGAARYSGSSSPRMICRSSLKRPRAALTVCSAARSRLRVTSSADRSRSNRSPSIQ